MSFLKYIIPAVIVLGILVAVVFFIFKNNPARKTSPVPSAKPITQSANPLAAPSAYVPVKGFTEIKVELKEQNKSGMSGSASLTSVINQTLVKVSLKGGKKDIFYPAFIKEGFCSALNITSDYLTRVKNGESTTAIDKPITSVLNKKPHSITVYSLGKDSITLAACGELGAY